MNLVDNLKDQKNYMRNFDSNPSSSSYQVAELADFTDQASLELPMGPEKISNLAIHLEATLRNLKKSREYKTNLLTQLEEMVENTVDDQITDRDHRQFLIFAKLSQ